jgi:hypothetical protein
MIRKKEETRKFFDDMERNIKNKIYMYSDDQQFDDEKIEQEIITVESAGWAELGPDPIETPFNTRNTGRATPTRSDLYNRIRTISSFDGEF